MKIKAIRVENGFFIPLIPELEDRQEIIIEIPEKEKYTEFVDFLYKIYHNKDNISNITDDQVIIDALKEKYEL